MRKSLKTILTYAEKDNELSDSFNSFPDQVRVSCSIYHLVTLYYLSVCTYIVYSLDSVVRIGIGNPRSKVKPVFYISI